MNLLVESRLRIPQMRMIRSIYKQLIVPREVALLRVVLPFFCIGVMLINLLARNLNLSSLRSLDQKQNVII